MKVTFEQLKAAFNRVLISRGVDSETADACAEMFARTTESGVYSHGVNRFPRFIQQLENGDIIPDAQPKRITSLGAIEQWDAQRSIGNLTAKKMMDRAIELAADHGIGLVALRNANHWMRGGSYGWQAAEKGYIGICWTNYPLPKSPRTTATNTAFHKFLLPLKWTSLSTVPPAMPSCNASWITLLVPSVLTKIRPFAYPAMNLLPCWPKTAVTASLLMTACGPKSRRYEEISHDFWTYRAAQSVPFARRH